MNSWLKNSTIPTHPAPGAPDFFRAILTRRRSPDPMPRLGFHSRAFRRGPEHGLGWDFAGAGGDVFRQNAAPDVRTARPGPDFFLSCVSVGAVPVADPPSRVPPTRVPAGARTLAFSKLKYRQQLLCFFKEYLENVGTKIEISPAITLFFLGLGN